MFAIRLRAEEDTCLVLFTATFHKNQELSIQNETVLTWTTPDGDDAALSFESIEGCQEFWQLICRFQGRNPDAIAFDEDEDDKENAESSHLIHEDSDSDSDEEPRLRADSRQGSYDFFEDAPGSSVEISFPERPEIGNLAEVEEAFYQALAVPLLRRRMAVILLEYNYIPALLDLFRQCEEFEKPTELCCLVRVFKCIFLLNNQEILKELLAEDNFLEVAGVFEYESESGMKAEYREYLSDRNRFKQVREVINESLF